MYNLFVFKKGSDSPTPEVIQEYLSITELLQKIITEAKDGDHTFVVSGKDVPPRTFK